MVSVKAHNWFHDNVMVSGLMLPSANVTTAFLGFWNVMVVDVCPSSCWVVVVMVSEGIAGSKWKWFICPF